MGATAPLQRELPRRPDASSIARRLLEQELAGALAPADFDTVKLLASELVSNAVRHGAGKIILAMRIESTSVRVCVSDEGDGFALPPRERDAATTGQWGLAIVNAQATRWGAHAGPTVVWFELELAGDQSDP